MAFYGASGAREGLTCPHCGETQGRPMSSVPVVLFCRKCGKSFTRRMGEGIHRRASNRKHPGKASGGSQLPAKRPSLLPAKRPSLLPAAAPATALRKVDPKS